MSWGEAFVLSINAIGVPAWSYVLVCIAINIQSAQDPRMGCGGEQTRIDRDHLVVQRRDVDDLALRVTSGHRPIILFGKTYPMVKNVAQRPDVVL